MMCLEPMLNQIRENFDNFNPSDTDKNKFMLITNNGWKECVNYGHDVQDMRKSILFLK